MPPRTPSRPRPTPPPPGTIRRRAPSTTDRRKNTISTPQHPSTNTGTNPGTNTTTIPPRFRAGAYLEGLLAEIAVNAVATLTHLGSPVSCGIAVVAGAHLVPVAASDSMARYLDHAQRRSGVGPGWDAALSNEPLYVTDTATDPRWPDYLEVVRHSPIRSIFSIPFDINGESTGVLGLYSPALDAFPHPLSARALHYVEQAASMIRPDRGTDPLANHPADPHGIF